MHAPHATPAAIAAFAEGVADHRAALAAAPRPGNGPALAVVDERLAAAAP
jgi:hypothetical protein